MFHGTRFQRYLLPGFVFQSVVIAGGYGTGRELAEFFLSHGPLGGLLAMVLVSTVGWSLVCALSFEFARVFRAYDYRTFFQRLLGRGWVAFEVCYFAFLLIVLAVIAAAAGSILQETFTLRYPVGVIGAMGAVGYLVFRGSATIERALSSWSLVLYAVYLVFFSTCFWTFGPDIAASLRGDDPGIGWFVGGIEYTAYNVALIPAVLFSLRHIETRREAIGSGVLAGPIAMFPAFLFYLAMVGQYPEVAGRPVPANYLLELLGSRPLQMAYAIMLFGTLIETGTGMIHAVNERIAGVYREHVHSMPRGLRPLVALAALIAGTGMARFGLIDLIAKGYGTLAWLFLFIYVIPMLTVGVWKLRARTTHSAPGD